MEQLFSLMPKPSRYLGIEEGSTHKTLENVRVHIALAFPDMYEIGMSYLGHKILANLINQNEKWWAERVFAPCVEAAKLLREHGQVLSSLESGTALRDFDAVGFSITHELCYTNILYMLDLAQIPLHSSQRFSPQSTGKPWPLIIAGGSCCIAAEPLSSFFDVMILGEGEVASVELFRVYEEMLTQGADRETILEALSQLPGIYVPSFFTAVNSRTSKSQSYVQPLAKQKAKVARQLIPNLDDAVYPEEQAIAFGAIHNRLALEIARGCTRGCRFCQAGMIYRPSRERSVTALEKLLDECLASTGYDDVSFLSLSTGDYSALKQLFMNTVERCAKRQVSVSLPSLRVGSIDDAIIERLSDLRRTGATIAPEAGSQRLRDVINKGISEEELILHVQKLYEHGWQQVKLYFMIGLPTETDEDLHAIVDLCCKARDAAGPGVKGLQITAAVSPFVPKAHTPFQWEAQISLEEIRRRIGVLLHAVKGEKRIKLRWHDPEISFLEGVFSRGDRNLSSLVELAFKKGAIFPSWIEHFSLAPWLEAMEELGIDPAVYSGARDFDEALPWDHLESGVSKEFLLQERKRAYAHKVTDDCRYGACRFCGVCDTVKGPSLLRSEDLFSGLPAEALHTQLNLQQRDQAAHVPRLDEYNRVITRSQRMGSKEKSRPVLADSLVHKEAQYFCWYSCLDRAVYLSQLELQSIFDRSLRRAGFPLSFSQGFHPMPLISFGRALPVGVGSECEWLSFYLSIACSEEDIIKKVNAYLPKGIHLREVKRLSLSKHNYMSLQERYLLSPASDSEKGLVHELMREYSTRERCLWERQGKKKVQHFELTEYTKEIEYLDNDNCTILLDWSSLPYLSPLGIFTEIITQCAAKPFPFRLRKLAAYGEFSCPDPLERESELG